MWRFATAAMAALLVASSPAKPTESEQHSQQRSLRLFHLHTGEHLYIVYWREQGYAPDALTKLDRFLRDSLTGAVHHFDPRLFDLLSHLTQASGSTDAELQVICGYRSPQTNEYLRTHATGVAQE